MKNIQLVLIFLVLISCKKSDDSSLPLIFTGLVTNISEKGATFNAKIVDVSNENIIEYGFLCDTIPELLLEYSEKYILEKQPQQGIFSVNIFTGLKKSKIYYVKAFVKTSSYISYGKTVSFVSMGSQAPAVYDIFPKKGNIGDTMIIVGNGFSLKTENNVVFIGDLQARLIKCSNDTIVTEVPANLKTRINKVSVKILNNQCIANDNFELIEPEFFDFSPQTAAFGSLITIKGNKFEQSSTSVKVYFDNFQAQISELSNSTIVVLVPDSLDRKLSKITVEMNNIPIESTKLFQLESFNLLNFTPKIIQTGSTFFISGTNFSSIASNNHISIGGIKAKVIKSNFNSIEAIVPLQDTNIYPSRTVDITVGLLNENKSFQEKLLINDNWFRLKDAPEGITRYPNHFVAGDKVFIGLNGTNQFWRFTPHNKEWVRMQNFPGAPRTGGTGFYLDGNIYFGTGSSTNNYVRLHDFWKYNIASNTWQQLSNFSGSERWGASGFSVLNKGYMTSGSAVEFVTSFSRVADCWEYVSNNDTWLKINDYEDLEWGLDGRSEGAVVAVGGVVYYGLGTCSAGPNSQFRVYKFNPSLMNEWVRIPDFPEGPNPCSIAFELFGVPYFRNNKDGFYRFNISDNVWEKVETHTFSDIEIGFSVNNIGYTGMGNSKSMWEFDPTR